MSDKNDNPKVYLLYLRNNFGSYEAIARELGVTAKTVNNWKKGRCRPLPYHMKLLKELCEKH